MRFLSVCSGIEAASIAWQPLGWKAAAVAEIDPFPAHVLHQRFGASRPMFMPDPCAGGLLKDRRARANAIKAVSTLPAESDLPNFGDMTQFKEWPDVTIDLLVGGTPCQSFSVAGLRKGMDDPRGNLAITYLAIAARYRPRWLVWENVPGVLSSNGGRDFGSFLGGLGQLGYGFAYRVLDAQYIRTCALPFAVPQRRRRVFVVGYLGDWRAAAAALFDGQSLRGDPAPRREAGQIAAPTLAARTRGGGGLGTDFDVDGGLIPQGVSIRGRDGGGTAELAGPVSPAVRASQGGVDKPHVLAPAIANPLTARMHKGVNTTMDEGQTMVAHALRGEGFDASEDGTGRGTPIVPVSIHGTQDPDIEVNLAHPLGRNHGQENAVVHPIAIQERAVCENPDAGPDGAGFREDGAAYTLEARTNPQAVAFAQNTRDEVRLVGGDGGIAGALAADAGMKQTTYVATPEQEEVATRWAVRRLSTVECCRLQGFPDDHTRIAWRGKPPENCPDGPQYKALGNSMATNAMGWLGERIQLVDDILGGKSWAHLPRD